MSRTENTSVLIFCKMRWFASSSSPPVISTDIYKRQVFDVLNYLGYRFSVRVNHFYGVCLLHFYDICNRNQLTLACCTGKVYVVLLRLRTEFLEIWKFRNDIGLKSIKRQSHKQPCHFHLICF
jgi:hypothetical protein